MTATTTKNIDIVVTHYSSSPLPQHFGIGLKNGVAELSWMTSSGVPWDYRYQYVNNGWRTWNSPDGQFATIYASDSLTNGLIPVYIYYGIGSSTWTDPYGTGLQSASNLNAYYADFTLMLQKIASAGNSPQAIVDVEPDFWGFMQQKDGDDPTWIPVSVASSGYPGLSDLPNTLPGFAQALLLLRDTYAPSVTMAWHASMWGPSNGYDPTLSNPASYQTPQVTGSRVATFYNAMSAKYDLIFHDPSDADSGYKVAVRGQSSSTAWWTNDAFTSYLQYISAVFAATGLQSMLWQVPVGNTLYRSVNNTTYHYQDNRPQYFLQSGNRQNISNYAAQGVLGALFGGGQFNSTDYMDYANDGITNPPAINGNNLTASYSDDDGGFLRTSAAAYYAGGTVQVAPPR